MAPFLTPSLPLVANNAILESCRLSTYSYTLGLGGTIPDPIPAPCCQQYSLRVNNGVVFNCRLAPENTWPQPQVVTAILGTMKQLGLAGLASGTSWIFMGPPGAVQNTLPPAEYHGVFQHGNEKVFQKCRRFTSSKVFFVFPMGFRHLCKRLP